MIHFSYQAPEKADRIVKIMKTEFHSCHWSTTQFLSHIVLLGFKLRYLVRLKEGRNWVLRRFQQLRSYRDEIETQNREEIPYSLQIVPRGLSVAEGP